MARPTKMTKETLHLLQEAYLDEATHAEAALKAGIAERTLYNYHSDNPSFMQNIDKLRDTGYVAKSNLRKSINEGNIHDSKWWLERRDPDFKPKKETDVNLNPHEDFVKMLIEKKGCKG